MSNADDWRLLLDQYPPPDDPNGDPDAATSSADLLPWQAALRAAGLAARRVGHQSADGKHSSSTPPDADQPKRVSPVAAHPDSSNGSKPHSARAVRAGDRVAISSLAGVRGRVLAVAGTLALVQTSSTRVRVRAIDLQLLSSGVEPAAPLHPVQTATVHQRPVPARPARSRNGRRPWHDLDLHGLKLSEALEELDAFLYDSWEQGLLTVAVIHGKGSGTLRAAVHAHLRLHPAVRQLQAALPNRGGEGVTIVELCPRPSFFHHRDDP